MITRIRKKNCVYTLEAKVMTFGVQKHGGSKQVGLKQLGSKEVGFKQLGHKQGAQGDREAEVFQVSNDDAALAQRWLEDKQLEEKTNKDCLVKEQEKGNVAEKKKAEESMEANLGKLLKYNAWSIRLINSQTQHELIGFQTVFLFIKGEEANVAEKKKVKASMEANLGKSLKDNA
ncbi:hypothetical protein Tco_0681136 [Tanacetum coccineum]|uniref:Uncharacterized protein n=1 Tax=Tanacetum coccineum TaxID=301880 RepID=A0ABQ4XMK4_9ASTR